MDEFFIFDNYVTGRSFAGRQSDCMALGNLISSHENVCLYAAPKCGKTSLVHQALINLQNSGRNFTVPVFDMSGVRTVEAFTSGLIASVMAQVCDSPADFTSFMQEFLGGTAYEFDPAAYEDYGKTVMLRDRISPSDITAALTLPYRVASERSTDLVFVFDDFQNI